MIDDLKTLALADAKIRMEDYFTNHNREALQEGDKHLVDQAVSRKLAVEIKNDDDEEFDKFVLDTVIPTLPEKMKIQVAREMNCLKRFANEKAQNILSLLCPKISRADDMNEILALLESEDTGVAVKGLSRARKFIENNQIADNERLKVATAVKNFDPTVNNIKKKEPALKKAKRAAKRYMKED